MWLLWISPAPDFYECHAVMHDAAFSGNGPMHSYPMLMAMDIGPQCPNYYVNYGTLLLVITSSVG